MTETAVRRLRDADRDGWQRLWDQYLRFYRAELSAHVSDTTFARLCETESPFHGLLAVDGDGNPVGLAHLIFHPSTWAEALVVYEREL